MHSGAWPLGLPWAPPQSPAQAWERFRGPGVQSPERCPCCPGNFTTPPGPQPQAAASLLGMGMPGLSTHRGKRSGYHGDPLLPLGSVPPQPSGSTRHSLKDPPQLLALLEVLLLHWEHSDLEGMIPGSRVTGTEAERAALGGWEEPESWSPPLPHPTPSEGLSGPEPLNLSDTLHQGEVGPSKDTGREGRGTLLGEGQGPRDLHPEAVLHAVGGLQAGLHTAGNNA